MFIGELKSKLANCKVPKQGFVVNKQPRNTMVKVQKNLLRERHHALFARWGRQSPRKAADRSGARTDPRALRERLSPLLHPRHALHAELLKAVSEIVRLDAAQASLADKLLKQGRARHEQLLAQPMPAPMKLIH